MLKSLSPFCFDSFQLLKLPFLLLPMPPIFLPILPIPSLPRKRLNNQLKRIISIIPNQSILPHRFMPLPGQRRRQIPMRESIYFLADWINDVDCCGGAVEGVDLFLCGEIVGVVGLDCTGQAFHWDKIIVIVLVIIKFLMDHGGQGQPDYGLFDKWFTDNGGMKKKIQFPTKFPPTGYIGISASEQIKRNQVFLAVPKKLIISPSLARSSQLNQILQKHGYNTQKTDQNQFQVLLLFLLWQKSLSTNSFFHPYFQAISKPCILIDWQDPQVLSIPDPFLSLPFINELREQLPGLYKKLHGIAAAHPEIFVGEITVALFRECYGMAVSRCFGWGLPETMMVPFADFFNHDCSGVYHYALNRRLETEQEDGEYVRKSEDLDLSLLGIASHKRKSEQSILNSRQKFLLTHKTLLPNSPPQPTNTALHTLHRQLLQQDYKIDLLPSSDSQDNDSEQQSEEQQAEHIYKARKEEIRKLNLKVKEQIQGQFREEGPGANCQFEDGVAFDWWGRMEDRESYFIVAAHRDIQKGEQVFNSYGRRNNRFLLTWYGFTHKPNKYNSIPLRLWQPQIHSKTGKLLFTRPLTEKDFHNGIPIGNERYSPHRLSQEYRLKGQRMCYELMAYLRIRLVGRKPGLREELQGREDWGWRIWSLELERLMLEEYGIVMRYVGDAYRVGQPREPLDDKEKDYFVGILVESNEEIVRRHVRGVVVLKQVIRKLMEGQSLIDTFRSSLTQAETEGTEEQIKEMRYENRRFVLDYFKMLQKYYQNVCKP